MINVLSIQSSVAYGHVGNSAAVFPLQLMGVEVWPVLTVHFAHHPGHGPFRGPVFKADQIREVIDGIEAIGVMPRCDAVLSGYLGSVELGHLVLDALGRVRRVRPDALFCCDPVLGDTHTGFYVRPDLPPFMREFAVPAADIVTPNQFELEYLTGRTIGSLDDAIEAATALRRAGPRIVLVTSLRRPEAEPERIEMLAVAEEGAWLVATPILPVAVHGTGDATSALFLAHYLQSRSIETALGAVADSVFGILEKTLEAGEIEIQLVAAQERIARPRFAFPVRRVR